MSVELGRRIRALRRLKRLTQQELASRIQISVSMLSNIERGQRKPETQLLINIASTLGVPDSELLNLTVMGENKKQMAPPGGNR